LNQVPVPHNGAILSIGPNGEEIARLQFTAGQISEIVLPGCDSASRKLGLLTLRITPQRATYLNGSGKPVTVPKRQQTGRESNFRLSIQGIDCSGVLSIDPVAAKQGFVVKSIGIFRDSALTPTTTAFSNLSLTVAEAKAGDFYAWMQSFLIQGNHLQKDERQGTLELLAETGTALQSVSIRNIGLVSCSPQRFVASTASPRTVKVELYCEQFVLGYPDLGIKSQPATL